ncbi:DNA polymerase III delta prime subunit [Granulicella aggregans]|uniref:DNA polymerase III delta prime subunit n=1 Tax=Granulicella aggregans TaxID=474949 RepID=A0A7W7Z8X6_9BACT|nr:AAA domain-containing protein [Granulicella aggregans]MBB5055461.1 DNA polymerase III delta prime subunit [Granulicella aggregans]
MTVSARDFGRDEEVRVELLTKSKTWVPIGVLDLDLSRNNQVAVDAFRYRAAEGMMLCAAGAELRFRSTLESENRLRRTVATKRILERKSVYPDLIDFFKASSSAEPTSAPFGSTAEHIAKQYALNESQTNAFLTVCTSKPLGLLQGPPGTGKTKFIAALIHYLLTHGVIRNVLLASQSNEAVNNATEGVLRLFRSGDSEPSLVRVGQEGQISETLKPYHSAKVEAHYREQFRAGLKQRFRSAAQHIGLTVEFSDDLFLMESTVWPVWNQLQSTLTHNDEQEHEETHSRVTSLQQTLFNLQQKLQMRSGQEVNWYSAEAYEDAIALLLKKHAITSAEQVRKLRGVAGLARDWMGSVTSRARSFEEFLANTRQIVAGTCVGLGRSSLGLSTARFDLVIIDEAARCTPSELAVPMQAGKWILLVGDHLQLEPFHQPEVIRETQRRLQVPKREIIQSDFERAFASPYGRQVGQTLDVQYRMLFNIGELVSRAFYRRSLRHGRAEPMIPASALPEELKHQLLWHATDRFGSKAYQKVAGQSGMSLCNSTEANAIADLLRRLDNHQPFLEWLATFDSEQKAIGIICTYGAQSELIRQKLRAIGLSPMMLNSCKVDTVDSYQGKENPIVILSLVRHNDDGKMEAGQKTIAPGFMSRANRINVALSRAMDRLIIVGAFQRWPNGGTMDRVTSFYQEMMEEGFAHLVEATAEIETTDHTEKRKAAPKKTWKGKSFHARKR